jgi:hypothetical protein
MSIEVGEVQRMSEVRMTDSELEEIEARRDAPGLDGEADRDAFGDDDRAALLDEVRRARTFEDLVTSMPEPLTPTAGTPLTPTAGTPLTPKRLEENRGIAHDFPDGRMAQMVAALDDARAESAGFERQILEYRALRDHLEHRVERESDAARADLARLAALANEEIIAARAEAEAVRSDFKRHLEQDCNPSATLLISEDDILRTRADMRAAEVMQLRGVNERLVDRAEAAESLVAQPLRAQETADKVHTEMLDGAERDRVALVYHLTRLRQLYFDYWQARGWDALTPEDQECFGRTDHLLVSIREHALAEAGE